MGVLTQLSRERFERPELTGDKLGRAYQTFVVGCDATLGSGHRARKCGEETSLIILYDMEDKKNIPIFLGSRHRKTHEFDFLQIDPEVVRGSVRKVEVQDYVDGTFLR